MTYEYLCEACGHRWEAQQSISDAPLKDCPSCGQPKAKRQISRGGGFILKGGGWYSDLYSSPSGTTSEPKASGDDKKEAPKEKGKEKADSSSSASSSSSETKSSSTADSKSST